VIVAALLLVIVSVVWSWLLVRVAVDLVRRDDLTPAGRTARFAGAVCVPIVGVAVYLASNRAGIAARDAARCGPADAPVAAPVRWVTGGEADWTISRARRRLEDGTISPAEFEAIRAEVRR
jgi:hypothetical protein